MTARLASWSRLAEPVPAAVVVAAALLLLSASWVALQHGFYRRGQIRDTHVYQRYGDAMVGGEVPYRDFGVEYPPGALPLFALPAIGHPVRADYIARFMGLMVACGMLAIVFCGVALRALGREPPEAAAALFFVALSPLALGSVVLSRFDLWPAALCAGALAAVCVGRTRLGFATLGLAVATKVYPAVLVPLFAAYAWRQEGRRRALALVGLLAAVVAAVVLPFLALAPRGVWDSVFGPVTRPLQLESLASAILLAAHHLFGLAVTWRSSHGSQNLEGALPDALAAVQSALQALALVALWVFFARSPPDRERLVRASAAAVCIFVALGKVVSPQFLIWLVPLVPLVRGRRGVVAGALLAAALVLTQLWFPYRYWDLVFRFDEAASWLVLARDAVLVALAAVLAWPVREPPLRA